MEGLQVPCLVHTNNTIHKLCFCVILHYWACWWVLGVVWEGLVLSVGSTERWYWLQAKEWLYKRSCAAVFSLVILVLKQRNTLNVNETLSVTNHGTILITWRLGLPGPFSHSLNLNIQRLLSMIPTLPVDTKASFLLLPYKLKRLKVKIGRLHNVFFNPRCVAL